MSQNSTGMVMDSSIILIVYTCSIDHNSQTVYSTAENLCWIKISPNPDIFALQKY